MGEITKKFLENHWQAVVGHECWIPHTLKGVHSMQYPVSDHVDLNGWVLLGRLVVWVTMAGYGLLVLYSEGSLAQSRRPKGVVSGCILCNKGILSTEYAA